MKKISQGFSLIELMIVVIIVGILAGIALPSYRQYAKRARFTEVLAATEPYKIAISLALQEGLALEELNNNSNGIPPEPLATKNLASLKVDKGIITAIGTALVDQATFILTPNSTGSFWSIRGSCIKNGFCEA